MQRSADDGDEVADLDAAAATPAVRPAERPLPRTPRRRRAVVAAAAGAVVLLAVGLTARHLAAPVGDEQPDAARSASPTGPPDPSSTAEQLFPVLAGPRPSGTGFLGDDLPTELGVVPDSERLLAVTPSSVFWVARDGGGVCLLVRDLSLTGGTSGRCASTGEVAVDGLTLDAADPGTAGAGGSTVSAVLLPAGLDGLPLRTRGYSEVASGLWLDGATASAVVEAAVDGTSTRIVVVPSQAHRGSSALPETTTTAGQPYAVVVACLPPPGERTAVEVAVTRTGVRSGVPFSSPDSSPGVREPVDCANGTVAHTFAGDGGPVEVSVTTPDDLVWAASLVACTGPLSRPTC